MTRLSARFEGAGSESGLTLVELLVASAMSVALLGAIGSMVLSSLRTQPDLSKKAQNISSARVALERMTRELRNGIAVEPGRALPNEVSFRTFLRRTTCGSTSAPPSSAAAIECQVTYACTTTSCSREETAPGAFGGGAPTTIVTGIDDSEVFSYSPSADEPTFVGITLHIPNPDGPADLTISDGASLRNAVLGG